MYLLLLVTCPAYISKTSFEQLVYSNVSLHPLGVYLYMSIWCWKYFGVYLVLKQAAKRGCGCPIPGGIQGQVGWGPGQPGLVLNVEVGGPVCGGQGWSFMINEFPSNPDHSVIL